MSRLPQDFSQENLQPIGLRFGLGAFIQLIRELVYFIIPVAFPMFIPHIDTEPCLKIYINHVMELVQEEIHGASSCEILNSLYLKMP